MLSLSSKPQMLHVARQVCLTKDFLHSLLFFSTLLPFSHLQSLTFPFLMKNVPWESEQRYFEHIPHTLGQCVARTPMSEHEVYSALVSNINLHSKGILLPPVVSSRICNGESLQRGFSVEVTSDWCCITTPSVLRSRVLAEEAPSSNVGVTTSSSAPAAWRM